MARKKKVRATRKKSTSKRKTGRPALVAPANKKKRSRKASSSAVKQPSSDDAASAGVVPEGSPRSKRSAGPKASATRRSAGKKSVSKRSTSAPASGKKPVGKKLAGKKSAGKKSVESAAPVRKYAFEIASRESLLQALTDAGKPLTHEQLAGILRLSGQDDKFEALGRRLGAMVRDGQILRNRRGGFLPIDEDRLVRGRISAHPDGFGFLINETGGEDTYLAARQMRSVMDGDRVVVHITGTDRRGRNEGAVVEILERAVKTLVGRLHVSRGVAVMQPDNKRIAREIVIDDAGGARDGQIVLANIVEYPTRNRPPIASVVEVLGEHLSPGMEIDIAIRSRDIPYQWPDEVSAESSAYGTEIDASAAGKRRNLRSMPLVTIDGADARDFDDAVYAEEKDNGFRLVVAIADVSHYVAPDSALDKEAYLRGTSVYFPQRVVPMLPESLSNGLCSLNPDVDRLCMVCDMTITDTGQIKRSRFYPATMRSHARLTYTEVYDYLSSSGKSRKTPTQRAAIDKIGALSVHIDALHKLFKVMSAARAERGAIEFESNETRIVFNDQKKIDKILPVERNDAHMLIEECMIAANICAARYIGRRRIPGLYRSHEGPSADKLLDLRKFLSQRGLSLGGADNPAASDYAETLKSADGRPDKLVIQTVLLRSMNQAVYSTGNAGHFGLALEEYAHFTSPIRRYPDLLVHRAIKHMLVHNNTDNYFYSKSRMAEMGDHCSITERRAEEATRDVTAWLKCEYMQDHIGSSFQGVVSAVTSFGLFVELSGVHVEGLVHITSLPQDYYEFESFNHQLRGRNEGLTFSLGQVITVVVAAVNLDERKIDFQMDKSFQGSTRKGSRRKGNAKSTTAKGRDNKKNKRRKKTSKKRKTKK